MKKTYITIEQNDQKGYVLAKTDYSLNGYVVVSYDKFGTECYQFFHSEDEARKYISDKFC